MKENFDLFKEINLFEENIEDCPKKSKNKLNCYFSQKHKSKKLFFEKVKTEKLKENVELFKEINLFEENVENCPKKSKNKLNCYFSQKHKSKRWFFEKVKTEVNNNEHYFEKLFSCENLLKDFQYYYY
ncbi:MAG: hypothetical protein H9Q65_00975 [Spiroplasma ixodetis]|nr:hypothetical protein [Spiroplasma ixodetis]MBP1527816.1 hypothetical protein [Spiroplasma ixodetis]